MTNQKCNTRISNKSERKTRVKNTHPIRHLVQNWPITSVIQVYPTNHKRQCTKIKNTQPIRPKEKKRKSNNNKKRLYIIEIKYIQSNQLNGKKNSIEINYFHFKEKVCYESEKKLCLVYILFNQIPRIHEMLDSCVFKVTNVYLTVNTNLFSFRN